MVIWPIDCGTLFWLIIWELANTCTFVHSIAGLVYSLGRKEYGRLGLGSENLDEKSEPTLVASLQDKKCVNVNCGSVVSFAVDDEGKLKHSALF